MPNGFYLILSLVIISACSCQTAIPVYIPNYCLLHLGRWTPMQLIVGWNVGRFWSVSTVTGCWMRMNVTQTIASMQAMFAPAVQALANVLKRKCTRQTSDDICNSHSWRYLSMGQTKVHCWVMLSERQRKTIKNMYKPLITSLSQARSGHCFARCCSSSPSVRCHLDAGSRKVQWQMKSNTEFFLNMNAKTIETSAWLENDCSQSTPRRRTTSELKKAATWK